MKNSLKIDLIDQLLPQTQCTKCGFDGCRPYAEAIANGTADINRCPPGGSDGIRKLANLLQVPEVPLDASRGKEGPLMVAFIHEEHCIGCTLCIQACPVDAIVGANKLMHTVLPYQCTGCDLCVDPCPVDCIEMVQANREWTDNDARQARQNYEQRNRRLQGRHNEPLGLAARNLANKQELSDAAYSDEQTRKQTVLEALAKARSRRSGK